MNEQTSSSGSDKSSSHLEGQLADLHNDLGYLANNSEVTINSQKYKIEEIEAIFRVLKRNAEVEKRENERKEKLKNYRRAVLQNYNSFSSESCRFCCSMFILWINPSYMCYRCVKSICIICVSILNWDNRQRIVCPGCCIDILVDLRCGHWFDLITLPSRRLIRNEEESERYNEEWRKWEIETNRRAKQKTKNGRRALVEPEKLRHCPELFMQNCFNETLKHKEEEDNNTNTWISLDRIMNRWNYLVEQRKLANELRRLELQNQAHDEQDQFEMITSKPDDISSIEKNDPIILANISYDNKENKILIYIHSCQNLPIIHDEYPTSYVEMRIQPFRYKKNDLRTKPVPSNCNPEFLESFATKISDTRIEQCNLVLTVYAGKHEIIGEVVLCLKYFVKNQTTKIERFVLHKPQITENNKPRRTFDSGFKSSSEDELERIPLLNEDMFRKFTSIYFQMLFNRTELEGEVSLKLRVLKLFDISVLPLKNDIKISFEISNKENEAYIKSGPLFLELKRDELLIKDVNMEVNFMCEYIWALSLTQLTIKIGNITMNFGETSVNIQQHIGEVTDENDWIPLNLKFSII